MQRDSLRILADGCGAFYVFGTAIASAAIATIADAASAFATTAGAAAAAAASAFAPAAMPLQEDELKAAIRAQDRDKIPRMGS